MKNVKIHLCKELFFTETLPFSDMMWYNAVTGAKGVKIWNFQKLKQ